MIRIDLGKDDTKRAHSPRLGKSLLRGLESARGPGAALLLRARTLLGGLSSIVILSLAVVLGSVPHLVFVQYRGLITRQHETKVAELKEKVQLITAEINKLKPFQKELESYENQKKLVQERIEVIQGLLNQRGTPVMVLDAVGQALPMRTWLTSFEFDLKSSSPTVNLLGESLSNEEISDYADKLLESAYLRDVTLESVGSQRAITGAIDVRNFKLTVSPKPSLLLRATKAELGTNKRPEGAGK